MLFSNDKIKKPVQLVMKQNKHYTNNYWIENKNYFKLRTKHALLTYPHELLPH